MSLKAVQTSRLMQAYVHQLKNHELRTKAITAGVLGFLQEILARHLAGAPSRRLHPSAGPLEHLFAASKINAKAFKMAIFGFLVSAPLGHAMVKTMQRIFAGRTGRSAKLGMLVASLLVIAPIQITVFLANSAVVEGARSKDAILRVVKRGFAPVLGVTWITTPTAVIFAQNFLPPEFEIPFFNLVQFCTGLFFNTAALKAALAAQKRKEVKKD
jgi:hypothetical protein